MRTAFLCISAAVVFIAAATVSADASRPNILWLTCEDISPDLGCYGVEYARTPALDALAARGLRYTNAVGITGVCAVNRSCLATGMYSSTIGTQDMRSAIRRPDTVRLLSAYLRRAGYYCTNNSKTDYNFAVPKDAWDGNSDKAHWKHRKPGQPFFAVFNYTGTHESQIWDKNHARHAKKLAKSELHDPAKAPIPPLHPDAPRVRRDWANYHDNIAALDKWIAERLTELEQAGLADDTIVFFYSDHGAGMPLVKKWIWNGGLRVPLIVCFPEKLRHLAADKAVGVTDRLVSFVDFPPTVLSLAGVAIPAHMQGRAFLGPEAAAERRFAFAIRDRMAESYDLVRVVRDKRYQYHRNFMPHLPAARFISYTLNMPTARLMVEWHERGKLNATQAGYFRPKPTEELYDLEDDPHCIHNLASDPAHAARLRHMRQQLHDWQLRTRDLGLMGEYEMLARAEGATPYEMGQDETKWPIARVLPVAELASQRDAGNVKKLVDRLGDGEPIVRWWAALGLLMLGDRAGDGEAALVEALTDEAPLVRIAAAQGLFNLGRIERPRAVLVEALKHPAASVRLAAMNVLALMGSDARPAIPAIRAAGMKDRHPATYLNRMVEYLPERLSR